MTKKSIFIICFIFATLVQIYWWQTFDVIDGEVWSTQAHYVETGDARQLDPAYAYNPPGGPIILGTIAIHKTFALPYHLSLILFMSFFNGLIIAAICTLCYILRKNNYWYIIILGLLSFNRLYIDSTPPSACVSLLIILLFILSLYMYEEHNRATLKTLTIWALIAGLAVATRVEVSILAMVFFLIILVSVLDFKKIIQLILGSIVAFIIFDPFMWKMPFTHLGDIISKVLIFHDKSSLAYINFPILFSISSLAFICILLAIVFIFFFKKNELPVPTRVIFPALLFTVVLYIILLTSHYQPPRYFLPAVMLWETLLSLYLIALFSKINFSFLKTDRSRQRFQQLMPVFVGCLLIGFQLAIYWVIR